MNWNSFWSSLLGTTIPAFCVSLLMLYLSQRARRALEQYKIEMAHRLSEHTSLLEQQTKMFSLWHEKRIVSLLEIYEAFRTHLDWLRRSLYFEPPKSLDVTPMHDFYDAIQEHLVYLNDDLRRKILQYQGELLEFWNWTVSIRSDSERESWNEVRRRLDVEIPGYLEKLRRDINQFADPHYNISSGVGSEDQ
jgi:hypothetical protein